MLVTLLGVQYACYRPYPPPRPSGVPAQAVWAGGMDGGSYILCDISSSRDVNHCTVWNDSTGRMEEEGDYRLLYKNRAATRDELQFHWADRAGRIGLRDNEVLIKISTQPLR